MRDEGELLRREQTDCFGLCESIQPPDPDRFRRLFAGRRARVHFELCAASSGGDSNAAMFTGLQDDRGGPISNPLMSVFWVKKNESSL